MSPRFERRSGGPPRDPRSSRDGRPPRDGRRRTGGSSRSESDSRGRREWRRDWNPAPDQSRGERPERRRDDEGGSGRFDRSRLARPAAVHPVRAHPEMIRRIPARPAAVHRGLRLAPVHPVRARLGQGHVRNGELARAQAFAMDRVIPARTVDHHPGWVASANWSRKRSQPHHRPMT